MGNWMKIDAALAPTTLMDIPPIARAAEAVGFDTLWVSETQHDPFLPGALIAEHTQNLGFGTAVAIAFARSPANLAYTAWDLAHASNGRFILGLGTQVKAHIERRFGMPWPASPVHRLREQIAAVRAFWQTWQTGEPLNLRGEDYKLTLMTPFFNPGPIAQPEIPIYIAGVNTGLARLAGEAADGFVVHPLHTQRYLEKVLLPAIQAGASSMGRDREAVKISVSAFTVTHPAEALFVRQQVAFYASTRSYRAVMALHGWEAEAETLSALASRKKWGEMPDLITDEMLETFAVVAEPDSLAARLSERYRGLADHLSLYLPFSPGERDAFWAGLVDALKESG
jgi:probable F420-dependent oxidoreductase